MRNAEPPRKYYFKKRFRIMLFLSAIITLLLPIGLYLTMSETQLAYLPMKLVPVFVLNAIFLLIGFLRIRTPLVLSRDGIEVFSRKIEFSEMARVRLLDRKAMGQRMFVLHIYKKKGFLARINPVRIQLSSFENFEDLIERIRVLIPPDVEGWEALSGGIAQAEVLARVPYRKPVKPIQHDDLTLDPQGVRAGGRVLRWSAVRMVTYPDDVISGYGALAFTFADESGEGTMRIKPRMSRDYLACLLYFVHYAESALFNGDLPAALRYSPKNAKADTALLFLIIGGIVLGVGIGLTMIKFIMRENSPLLPSMTIFLPMAFGVIAALLMVRNRKTGRISLASRTVAVAMTVLVPFAVLAFFLAQTPAAGHIMVAHAYGAMNKPELAEKAFLRALAASPESVDAQYEIGLYYMDHERLDEAVVFFETAYTGDPEYWNAYLMILIPETYEKLGKDDTALSWCARLSGEHPDNRSLRKGLAKVRARIETKRPTPEPIL